MICRRCLQRASSLRAPLTATPRSITLPIRRTISSTTPVQEPAAAASSTTSSTTPPAAESTHISSCPEGTILKGLNYFKNKVDPVALADDAYPPWLWKCLDVQKKIDDEGDADAGDEFSKSKKQRRLAAKRQRLYEARLIAEGNLEALAPKIPLQHQSINMPANEENTTEGALRSIEARQELTRAMRRERKAKIKESNYLKSM